MLLHWFALRTSLVFTHLCSLWLGRENGAKELLVFWLLLSDGLVRLLLIQVWDLLTGQDYQNWFVFNALGWTADTLTRKTGTVPKSYFQTLPLSVTHRSPLLLVSGLEGKWKHLRNLTKGGSEKSKPTQDGHLDNRTIHQLLSLKINILGAWKMAQHLRALVVFRKLGFKWQYLHGSSQNHLWLQFQRLWCPLLVSTGTRHMTHIHTLRQNIPRHHFHYTFFQTLIHLEENLQ